MSRSYDLAVINVTGDYNSPSAFLNFFSQNGENVAAYSDEEYLGLVNRAEREADVEASAKLYHEAEKMLVTDAVFVPICFQTEYFMYNNNASELIYNPFSRTIDYSKAIYKK